MPKRKLVEVEVSEPVEDIKGTSLVRKIRNMWQFANVMQFIYIFGKALKIDEDFGIEDFENECLKPGHSEKIESIGLQLLKFVSWQRGLTFDVFEQHVRRQWEQKLPNTPHPFGEEEEPNRFRDFDIFTKINVLHALTVISFHSQVKLREAMPHITKESDQADSWRINVFGWDDDADDEDLLREYYLLDDNRLYRRTPPSLPATTKPKTKPKANTLKAQAARRRESKRRKIEQSEVESEGQEEDDETTQIETKSLGQGELDTLAGFKWECVAITLDDYNAFIASLRTNPKTKYPNERALRERLICDVLPTIEKAAEKQLRKQEQRERELVMLERMAGAKRSSRIADKQEKDRREHEEAESARKRAADLAAAHREQDRQAKMEFERQSRMMTREQRIKDREYKRLLMEEELTRNAEEAKAIEEGTKRGSERHIREKIEKSKLELQKLEEEDEWTFDCSGCGVYGKNFDDGKHSVACEKCSVWQHSKCLGIDKSEAEKEDFHFVCADCKRKEEEASRPKIMLKFDAGSSSSPPTRPPSSPIKSNSSLADVQPRISEQFVQTGSSEGGLQKSQADANAVSPHSQLNGVPSESHRPAVQAVPFPSSTGHPFPQSFSKTNGSTFSKEQSGTAIYAPPAQPINGHGHTQPQQQQFGYVSYTPSSQSQWTPQHPSAHTPSQHPSPSAVRLPSPVINRPTISPTQGNPDVGPIAGVPNSSPNQFNSTLFSPPIASGDVPQLNGQGLPSRSSPSSSPPGLRVNQLPQAQHLSGLSPTKQRVNGPLPSMQHQHIPEKTMHIQSASPAPQPLNRSVSGTPIFPPAEKLAPSPEQINREPVPTPSKQPMPFEIGETPQPSFDSSSSINGVATSYSTVASTTTAPSFAKREVYGTNHGASAS